MATRKFRQERIWQEKYAAYQRVLEALEAIRYWGDEASADVHMLPTVGRFGRADVEEFYAKAKREVAKQSSIGTILLSEKFVAELSVFQSELFSQTHAASEDRHDDHRDAHLAFGDHASQVRNIANKFLPRLIEFARKDLGA